MSDEIRIAVFGGDDRVLQACSEITAEDLRVEGFPASHNMTAALAHRLKEGRYKYLITLTKWIGHSQEKQLRKHLPQGTTHIRWRRGLGSLGNEVRKMVGLPARSETVAPEVPMPAVVIEEVITEPTVEAPEPQAPLQEAAVSAPVVDAPTPEQPPPPTVIYEEKKMPYRTEPVKRDEIVEVLQLDPNRSWSGNAVADFLNIPPLSHGGHRLRNNIYGDMRDLEKAGKLVVAGGKARSRLTPLLYSIAPEKKPKKKGTVMNKKAPAKTAPTKPAPTPKVAKDALYMVTHPGAPEGETFSNLTVALDFINELPTVEGAILWERKHLKRRVTLD